MKRTHFKLAVGICFFGLMSCSTQKVLFDNDQLDVFNREVVSISPSKNALALNNKRGSGLAIIKDVEFDDGVFSLELKGENNPGKSFVGIAFNIQNDSTYEAVYFRPFNFQSDEKISRSHSAQYIYHPKYTWRYLRTNHEGQYEAEYPRQPSPDDWFGVRVKIDDTTVTVYDEETDAVLLNVDRLTEQVSDRIGLWTGFDSKGEFRNLGIKHK